MQRGLRPAPGPGHDDGEETGVGFLDAFETRVADGVEISGQAAPLERAMDDAIGVGADHHFRPPRLRKASSARGTSSGTSSQRLRLGVVVVDLVEGRVARRTAWHAGGVEHASK